MCLQHSRTNSNTHHHPYSRVLYYYCVQLHYSSNGRHGAELLTSGRPASDPTKRNEMKAARRWFRGGEGDGITAGRRSRSGGRRRRRRRRRTKKRAARRAFKKRELPAHNFAVAILLAFAAPSVGLALAPDITAKWIAVILIFILTGISLKTEALVESFHEFEVQCRRAAVQPRHSHDHRLLREPPGDLVGSEPQPRRWHGYLRGAPGGP